MLELPLYIFTKDEDFPFFIQYGFHEKENELHGHKDFSELVMVMNGSATHTVENEQYHIKKGDVFVIDQYTHHRYTDAENFRICNIMFRPEYMFQNLNHIRQNSGFQALFVLEPYYAQNHHFSSRLCLKPEDFSFISRIISEMIQEYTFRNDGWQTLIYSRFIQLCTILSRLYQSCNDIKNNDILKLASAIAHIEKNFCSEITISDLAHISGYSIRQLNRLFNSAFSISPSHYLCNLRIQKAQQLLKSTNMSMAEIAWSCGFSEQNYFSRIFKKYTGITPTRYRSNSIC